MPKSDAQRQRESRARKKQAKVDAELYGDAIKSKTEKEWHEKMRATLKPEELQRMVVLQEEVFDQTHYMRAWLNGTYDVDPNDEEVYVPLDSGIADLVRFTKEHPPLRFSGIHKERITPAWSTQSYWKDTQLLHDLENESPEMAAYVRYGFYLSVPDNYLERFLRDVAKWSWEQRAELIGWRAGTNGYVYYEE